jgi:predicted membrane channel-forming protein YqfA (hemolysin III family)
MAKENKKDCAKNPYTGIAGVIGGTTIAMIALIVIFAPVYAWTVVLVVISMAILGIALGAFASKKNK